MILFNWPSKHFKMHFMSALAENPVTLIIPTMHKSSFLKIYFHSWQLFVNPFPMNE